MGMFTFSLPPNLPSAVLQDLERVSVTGGPDAMPTVCQIHVAPNRFTITRDADESGSIICPWLVEGAGHLIIQTATLIERANPYLLQTELARGKINQLRNQASDWLMGGLNMPADVAQQIKEATRAFTRAVVRTDSVQGNAQADTALAQACAAADNLVRVYMKQVFQVRQSRQPRLDTLLGCRLPTNVPVGEAATALPAALNSGCLGCSIHEIAPTEGDYLWDKPDAVLDWAQAQGLAVTGGPLVDFSTACLPSWLWLWQGDRAKIAKQLCEYTADVLEHYQGKISTWQLTAASNLPGALSLNDDELLWLTVQMGETARRIAPGAGLIIGIAQPWGDYLREQERMYSPFVFADTILRTGLPVTALDLEIILGVSPRGSYCRDLLDFSRLLDLYALLGVPLQVTLAYPAERGEDERTDSQLGVSAGHWRGGIDADVQAHWAAEFAALAMCKPYVRGVQWAQYTDAEPHQFPHCGLLDASGKPRPALGRLRALRETYLR